MKLTPPMTPLSTDAKRCPFQLLPSQQTLLVFFLNTECLHSENIKENFTTEVNSTVNRTRIIYAHATIRFVSRRQDCC